MRRSNKFFAFIALVAALSATAAGAGGSGKLDEVLANMERAARSIKGIEADLRQEKRDMQIGGKEVYSGKIYFQHSGKDRDKLRIDYTVPEGQVVGVNGDKITLYQKSINQVILTTRKAQASKSQEFSFIATPYKSVPELKSQYNIVHAGDEQVGSGSTAKLELTPKGPSSAKKVILWVDQSSWLPIKYQVTETNNNITTFTLNNLKRGDIPGNKFNITWPPGTKVVQQ
jgi:outer membrane lipoprotein-sorting protein